MMIGPSGLRAIAAAAVALVVSTPLVAADRYVHRRSGLSPWRVARVVATPDELVVSIDDRGLIREDRITWDRVAAVDPDSAGRLEVGVSTGLALGDRIWRGIRRLQRGDARLAREAFTACTSPGKSAWSESTKPRSNPRRRRTPRIVIQPLAIAILVSPNVRNQRLPAAEGGAITIARPPPARRVAAAS
jgi:hypothetical protein